MNIVSFNPGHDGALVCVRDARLVVSIEAEKDSNYRYSPVSSHDVFKGLAEVDEVPDVICTGGWWPRERDTLGSFVHAGYRGTSAENVVIDERRLLGKPVTHFSSSHERSHIMCAF